MLKPPLPTDVSHQQETASTPLHDLCAGQRTDEVARAKLRKCAASSSSDTSRCVVSYFRDLSGADGRDQQVPPRIEMQDITTTPPDH